MRIAQSELWLSGQHAAVQARLRRESLVAGFRSPDGAWEPDALTPDAISTQREGQVQEPGPTLLDQFLASQPTPSSSPPAAPDSVTSARSQHPAPALSALSSGTAAPLAAAAGDSAPTEIEPSVQDKGKLQLILAAIEALSGKKIKLVELRRVELAPPDPIDPASLPSAPQQPSAPSQTDWGVRYQSTESSFEAETTRFAAVGTVRTEDGRELPVAVSLSMSRESTSEKSVEIRLGAAAQDPLVVNFEGGGAELTQAQYRFDLDGDGTEEQIHFAGPRHGFLALDQNQNGVVDHGGELFGPRTGDGFAELAAHDQDQNGWIDEADPVYRQLRLWSKDEQGQDQLLSLGQRGIGAIYLRPADTPFDLKGGDGQAQGQVRTTGVYLREDGSAGTVQHLDLVV